MTNSWLRIIGGLYMNINKFTQKSLQAVQDCEKMAYDYGHQELVPEHLLYSLLTTEDSLIAKLFEKEYGVSNTTARQALSRAQSPVNKNCTLSFDKNQKFFYLEEQFMSSRYITAFLGAIKESSHVNWVYICAFIAQNGYGKFIHISHRSLQ
mgnify:CR=1 FL=1